MQRSGKNQMYNQSQSGPGTAPSHNDAPPSYDNMYNNSVPMQQVNPVPQAQNNGRRNRNYSQLYFIYGGGIILAICMLVWGIVTYTDDSSDDWNKTYCTVTNIEEDHSLTAYRKIYTFQYLNSEEQTITDEITRNDRPSETWCDVGRSCECWEKNGDIKTEDPKRRNEFGLLIAIGGGCIPMCLCFHFCWWLGRDSSYSVEYQ